MIRVSNASRVFSSKNNPGVISRIRRMPASADLLDMFLEHMEEIVSPPMKADEIDPAFSRFKHQITIHIMKKRRRNESGSNQA